MALSNINRGAVVNDANHGDDDNISFVCQRCLQPLKINPSFYSMNEHTLAELSLPMSPAPEINLESDSGSLDKLVPPFHLPNLTESNATLTGSRPNMGGTTNSHGFTLVGESGQQDVFISQKLAMSAELFDIISSNSDVDHPLCEECTDTLLDTMDQKLRLAEEEAQEYQAYLQKLEDETEDESRVWELERELANLQMEEEKLRTNLASLKDEQIKAEEDLQVQVQERDKLEKEEQRYWKEYSKYKRELLMAEDDFRSLDCQVRYAQSQMEKLRKTNIFSASFHIWHTGHFATINGFRLGRLPSVPVEWNEINAAWGQTALLLSCLAKKVGMEFQKYNLVPYGSYSYIKVIADGKVLPLYGSGGFKMIFDTKFDMGMVAFLDCLQQFAAEVVQKQGCFSLPYEMDKGKIKDNNTGVFYSIKLQFNSEDSWTKACRYMLTNLKWGLAWITSVHTDETG